MVRGRMSGEEGTRGPPLWADAQIRRVAEDPLRETLREDWVAGKISAEQVDDIASKQLTYDFGYNQLADHRRNDRMLTLHEVSAYSREYVAWCRLVVMLKSLELWERSAADPPDRDQMMTSVLLGRRKQSRGDDLRPAPTVALDQRHRAVHRAFKDEFNNWLRFPSPAREVVLKMSRQWAEFRQAASDVISSDPSVNYAHVVKQIMDVTACLNAYEAALAYTQVVAPENQFERLAAANEIIRSAGSPLKPFEMPR